MIKGIRILVCGLFLVVGIANAQHAGKATLMEIETEYGSCVVRLYDETPAHRDNFIKLIKQRFFDKTTFHRIIKNFVVQGGDPDSLYLNKEALDQDQHWMKPELIDALIHKRGALGMGRDDNPAKNSFTTQFYLVTGKKWTEEEMDAVEKKLPDGRKIPAAHRAVYKSIGGLPYLDGNYTVFGEVVKGMDVLDKLSNLPGDKDGNPNKPVGMKLRIVKKHHD